MAKRSAVAQAAETYSADNENFAALLEESFTSSSAMEGSVVKGIIVGIENDFALIDVGLKCEGRVALKEFAAPGRAPEVKVGDVVEVFLDPVRGDERGLAAHVFLH